MTDPLEQCRDELGERVPQAGILFAAIDLEHELLVQGIDDAWPGNSGPAALARITWRRT